MKPYKDMNEEERLAYIEECKRTLGIEFEIDSKKECCDCASQIVEEYIDKNKKENKANE